MDESGAQGWWEEYFDRDFIEIYTPLLPPEMTREEVGGVVEMLGLPTGSDVLDLACGWGRHAIELAGLGYSVTGADLSETLLQEARSRSAAAGADVEWVRADMRKLPWTERFDAVVSLFSSLGYSLSDAEDLRVLRAVRSALRPAGLFLMETMHRDQVVRQYAERDWWEGEDGTHVWVEREFDAARGVSREWLRWRGSGGEGKKYHELRVRTATEWIRLIKEAGLEPLACYGDWEQSDFTHESERLLLLARRSR